VEPKYCASAAAAGQLDALRWAREHDCPWDDWTCAYAAAGGHLEVLQWARAHSCPWDGRTVAAPRHGRGGEPIQYVEMLAAEEAARLASDAKWASAVLMAMAVAAAVEAVDTWRSTHASMSRTGLLFLLNLLFRPLVNVLLRCLPVALAVIIVWAVREVHIFDPATAQAPWQHRLDSSAIISIFVLLVFLLLAILLLLLNPLRVLGFVLLISVFAPFPMLARRTDILIQILLCILILVLTLFPSFSYRGPRY